MEFLKKLLISGLINLMILHSGVIIAADPPPPPGGGHSQGGNINGAPIDGGLEFLLVMGSAYGLKKIWQEKKRKEKAQADQENLEK